MKYKAESIDFDEAKKLSMTFPFALVYMISDVKLSSTEKLKDFDWDECIEARFFGKDSEIHILADDNKAVLVKDDGDEGISFDTELKLKSKYSECGKTLISRQYLTDDEDGQYRTVLTRLVSIQ